MPLRSSSFVRHDAIPEDRVLAAAHQWVRRLRRDRPELVRVGYFGSYARGDYVPGSDFDVLIEITRTDQPRRIDRPPEYLPQDFPVGIELFVYTTDELTRLRRNRAAFIKTIDSEIRWLS